MDKYKKTAEKRLTSKVHPDRAAKEALVNAEFASRERENFFNDAYGEILIDLFIQWLKSDPHENKTREFLYSTAMALGSVKEKLIGIETYGKNIPILTQEDNNNE
jgi:sulfatase maturation enzyme AslB (radical SAM superfamily)